MLEGRERPLKKDDETEDEDEDEQDDMEEADWKEVGFVASIQVVERGFGAVEVAVGRSILAARESMWSRRGTHMERNRRALRARNMRSMVM